MARADLKVIQGGADRGTSSWATRLRKETATLAKQIDEQYIELAERLWEVFDTPIDNDRNQAPIYTSWGFSSFPDYVKEELGIHPKRAQRLVRIWHKLGVQLVGLDTGLRQRIVRLGFSKVRELVGVLTPKNAEAWVNKAEELSYLKLTALVEKYKAERDLRDARRAQGAEVNGSSPLASSARARSEIDMDSDPDDSESDEEELPVPDVKSEDFAMRHFSLAPDQLETVELALRRASELSNSDKRGHNLSLIALDFLATNTFTVADEEQRLRFLQKFERLLGFKLIVVDPVAEEVLYGISTLEKLAKGA